MQAQYKNLFSEEGINELQNRLRGRGGAVDGNQEGDAAARGAAS